MIWTASNVSGPYRIIGRIRDFQLWYDTPDRMAFIGSTDSLKAAKELAEKYASEVPA